ncbi:MAG: hypothetical protein D6687_05715 [Acidobacteria bacterium]|nr:MAG: hypothetical protein D6687_05715 [Acidobacteriota bacterium]
MENVFALIVSKLSRQFLRLETQKLQMKFQRKENAYEEESFDFFRFSNSNLASCFNGNNHKLQRA